MNPRPTRRSRPGTTLVELMATLGVVVVLLAVTLPALARGVSAGRAASSADNVRTLAAAHAVYATDWNGRQLTFVDDLIAAYGNNAEDAFANYEEAHGELHPPVALGWGRFQRDDPASTVFFAYRTGNCANAMLSLPIVFNAGECNSSLVYFGSFRLMNAAQFNPYLGGRFYDETFYTPEDPVVFEAVESSGAFEAPDEYWRFAEVCGSIGQIPAWSSYCLSPAAMFNPLVMAHDDSEDPIYNGFRSPWELVDGFRSPPVFHALYPHLKTHVLEHHWVRGVEEPAGCNPGFDPGTYGSKDEEKCCEPYYFNHGLTSAPLASFYDGHVAPIVVADAMADDALVREQNETPNWGLWSKDTVWGEDGYFGDYGYDQADTSFHMLTTDGIRGRNIVEPASPRPRGQSRRRSDAKRPPARPAAPLGARLSPLE